MLNENIDEFKNLEIFTNEDLDFENKKLKSLNSDLSSLYVSLFSMTKFENSKPYKMIDYILNNDNNYLSSKIDRENLEEMKRTVYNRPVEVKDDLNTIYKTLYQYFKMDFSSSLLFKIFDGLNKIIQENYIGQISHISEAKKDKFTYQSYLTEKLKNNYYNQNILREINDKEMWKSVIYICNKNLKNLRRENGKAENNYSINDNSFNNNISQIMMNNSSQNQELNSLINNNLDLLKTISNDRTQIEQILKELVHITLKDKFTKKNIFRKINKMLPIAPMNISRKGAKKIILKLLEYFTKEKEDDYEKIYKKIEKFDKDFKEEDIKPFWILFKLCLHLNTLDTGYISDETFWKMVQGYVAENEEIVHKSTVIKNPNSSHKKR